MNICGVLVHVVPDRMARVAEALAALPGLEIHATPDTGRLIVTVEDTADTLALDTLTAIHRTSGVVAAALVYHHLDADADVGPDRLN